MYQSLFLPKGTGTDWRSAFRQQEELLKKKVADNITSPEISNSPLKEELDLLKFPSPTADRNRTVSRRSKPNSRITLIGEQPNPWDLLQPQDVMSRHRGAKRCRRYELLNTISLLSPAYLLSVER
ncbi:unnamed protein product [Onchocerca ochengi]|uniref:CDCA7 n=1 Tax=Onchocerca ochengi TaxID=42157 RepID=A0A182EIR8_ONCOC|nr:unnamed protein product [Onchocerca ochengi]